MLATERCISPGTLVSSTKKNWPPQYNRNIVESGVKHHNPNPFIERDKVSSAQLQVMGPLHTHFSIWVMLIIEDTTVTVKCRTTIKVLFLYFNVCQLSSIVSHIHLNLTSTLTKLLSLCPPNQLITTISQL